jgi:hypothetical protein
MIPKTGSDTSIETNRRDFLGGLGKAAVVSAAVVAIAPIVETAEGANGTSDYATRASASFNYRKGMALAEKIDMGVQADNGDAARFTDFSGSYSKALLHDALGVPNAEAWLSLRNAFASGDHADFENILVGTPGGGGNSRLNGPQGALAFDLQGRDSHATVIPAAPSVASSQTAAEQVEHYWGALLAECLSANTRQTHWQPKPWPI